MCGSRGRGRGSSAATADLHQIPTPDPHVTTTYNSFSPWLTRFCAFLSLGGTRVHIHNRQHTEVIQSQLCSSSVDVEDVGLDPSQDLLRPPPHCPIDLSNHVQRGCQRWVQTTRPATSRKLLTCTMALTAPIRTNCSNGQGCGESAASGEWQTRADGWQTDGDDDHLSNALVAAVPALSSKEGPPERRQESSSPDLKERQLKKWALNVSRRRFCPPRGSAAYHSDQAQTLEANTTMTRVSV